MAIGIGVGFIVLSLLVMAVWFAKKQKRKSSGTKIGYAMPSPFASSQNSGKWLKHRLSTIVFAYYV